MICDFRELYQCSSNVPPVSVLHEPKFEYVCLKLPFWTLRVLLTMSFLQPLKLVQLPNIVHQEVTQHGVAWTLVKNAGEQDGSNATLKSRFPNKIKN